MPYNHITVVISVCLKSFASQGKDGVGLFDIVWNGGMACAWGQWRLKFNKPMKIDALGGSNFTGFVVDGCPVP